MAGTGQSRAGRGRRGRLSDEETARRVLDAALARLAEEGISVGLDRLRFEDAIRAADVSRASAYRRWPTRDAFVEDVLVELARGSYQPAVGAVVGERAAAVVRDHAAAAHDPTGRRDLLVELVRLTFDIDLAASVSSPELTGYLALRAAFAGVEHDELRARIAAALEVGDRRAVARGAAVLARTAELFGMRLVAPLAAPEGYEVVARALTAANLGFVVAAQADPGLLSRTRETAAYGSSGAAPWSVPTYVLTGLVLQHLEPDPGARPLPADELLAGLAGIVDVGARAAAAATDS